MMLINQSDFPSTRWTGIPWFRQVLCKVLFILGPEFQVSLRVPHQSTVISGPRGSESVSFVRLFVRLFVWRLTEFLVEKAQSQRNVEGTCKKF
jgi:hypothetical protein